MKAIPVEFLQMVELDISRINQAVLPCADEDTLVQLHREIDGRYQACILSWGKSMWGFSDKFGFSYSMLEATGLLDNLKMMKAKLETFRYQVNAVPNMMPANTNVTVNIDNNVNVQVTFETVRSQIKDNNSLTVEQTKDALDKVHEIEQIVHSKDDKKTKWGQVRPILTWLADKSIDVGVALMPLILKING